MKEQYLTISVFALRAGVSQQAIGKQTRNPNSRLFPYIKKENGRTLINSKALFDLYKIDLYNTETHDNPEATENNPEATETKPEKNPNETASNPTTTQEQPIETQETTPNNPTENPRETQEQPQSNGNKTQEQINIDYIEYLKAQVLELKHEKQEIEEKYIQIIADKDKTIKAQSESIIFLSNKCATIADKAISNRLLESADKLESDLVEVYHDTTEQQTQEPKKKKGFLSWLFGN